jgi:hypothetical protein
VRAGLCGCRPHPAGHALPASSNEGIHRRRCSVR